LKGCASNTASYAANQYSKNSKLNSKKKIMPMSKPNRRVSHMKTPHALLRSARYAIALLLACCLSAACSEPDNNGKKLLPPNSPGALTPKDYLCAITPGDCHGALIQKLYLAPPDAMYERKVGGKPLRIPMAYLDFVELLQDPRSDKNDSSLWLESLLPDLGPRTPQNLREYFMPYERSRIGIEVGHRLPGAIEWSRNVEESRSFWLGSSNKPIRRPDKYGLEIWGEDFARWPQRAPCANLGGKDEPVCGRPTTPDDVLTPLQSRTSLMVCPPELLVDVDAKVVALPEAEREAYFASRKNWEGKIRSMCRHQMYYAPLNARVTLHYPRRFIAQWQQTEAGVRSLLNSFLVPDQAAPQKP
jgi:hypothetical protein